MKIGRHVIGEQPFVIAEVGLNHNGDVDRALWMVRVAAKAGVDCVKFQTFRADEFCRRDDPLYPYFKAAELPPNAWPRLKQECDRHGVVFLSTPQNPSDLAILLPLGMQAIKVGSDDCANLPLIEEYSSHGIPLIISTGMTLQEDLWDTVVTLGDTEAAFLVCTSQYPTPPAEARVSRVRSLARFVKPRPVGFSDHTMGQTAAVMAVSLGAVIFEKHFTLSRTLEGPDHAWACLPDDLARWCSAIREAWILKGDDSLGLTHAEEAQRARYQRRPGEQLRGVAA